MSEKSTYEELEKEVQELRETASELKLAKKALEDSEEKYRKVVENVNVGMIIVQDLKFVFANHTISTFLGYSQNEILSNPNPFQFIHPDDAEMVFERHIKRIENDNDVPDTYPFRVVTKDGDVKWVEVTGARINWEDKPAILNFFMDITERKLAAEKLEELNSIINRSPVVVFLRENETNWPVEFVSENVEDVFGYTVEEFITGRIRYADIVHPDDLERVIREVTTFSQERDKKEFVHEPYRIITQNREIKWIDDRTHIRRNRKGDITHYQGIVLDITDRYLAEEALKESRNTLNGILSASPVGIGLVENRVLKWANESFLKMFGFESEEEYRDNDTMMLYATEDEYHRVGNSIYNKLKSGKPADEDTALIRKDGSIFNGHVKMSCHDPSNPMDKAIMTISNISWRKRAETERINKEKLQGVIETAGAVCHELNQPLQSISGYAGLLIMDIENDHPYYDKITKIKSQVDRMGDLTQKLMGITKYETMEYLKGRIIDIDKAAG